LVKKPEHWRAAQRLVLIVYGNGIPCCVAVQRRFQIPAFLNRAALLKIRKNTAPGATEAMERYLHFQCAAVR